MQTDIQTVAGASAAIEDRLAEIALVTAELKKLPQNEFIDLERQAVRLVAHQLVDQRNLLSDALARARKRTEKSVPQRMADVMADKFAECGFCTDQHLVDAGFSPQEVIEFNEEARALARARTRGTPHYHAA
ncbi:MAG: hypothetical protein H6883_07060 [Rhodobiaceae bacterium]|nr:hypothetical protein [Rhodobiaceae bacterium]MCC0055879.1 hypothetical protein [Rhodobiaceae bacterium]